MSVPSSSKTSNHMLSSAGTQPPQGPFQLPISWVKASCGGKGLFNSCGEKEDTKFPALMALYSQNWDQETKSHNKAVSIILLLKEFLRV